MVKKATSDTKRGNSEWKAVMLKYIHNMNKIH